MVIPMLLGFSRNVKNLATITYLLIFFRKNQFTFNFKLRHYLRLSSVYKHVLIMPFQEFFSRGGLQLSLTKSLTGCHDVHNIRLHFGTFPLSYC